MDKHRQPIDRPQSALRRRDQQVRFAVRQIRHHRVDRQTVEPRRFDRSLSGVPPERSRVDQHSGPRRTPRPAPHRSAPRPAPGPAPGRAPGSLPDRRRGSRPRSRRCPPPPAPAPPRAPRRRLRAPTRLAGFDPASASATVTPNPWISVLSPKSEPPRLTIVLTAPARRAVGDISSSNGITAILCGTVTLAPSTSGSRSPRIRSGISLAAVCHRS